MADKILNNYSTGKNVTDGLFDCKPSPTTTEAPASKRRRKRAAPEIDESTFVGRLRAFPMVMSKTGGPMFEPAAGGINALVQSGTMFYSGKDDKLTAVAKSAVLFSKSKGFMRPLGPILAEAMPLVQRARDVQSGKRGVLQVAMEAPQLVGPMSSGMFYQTYKAPGAIMSEMGKSFSPITSEWNRGRGKTGPDDGKGVKGGFSDAKQVPVMGTAKTLLNGILGNILDSAKLIDQGLDVEKDALTQIVRIIQDPDKTMKAAVDPDQLVEASVGGISPNALLNIGIDAKKIIAEGVGPASFILAGVKQIPDGPNRVKWGTTLTPNLAQMAKAGFDETKMKTVDLDISKFLYGGLLESTPTKLNDANVDPFNLLNRVMRSSVVDRLPFNQFGISFKKVLLTGIPLELLFAGGKRLVPDEAWKTANIKIDDLSNLDQFKSIGLKQSKFAAKGIDMKQFLNEGIENMDPILVKKVMGIKHSRLIRNIYCGFNRDKMAELGIDLDKMIKSGLSPGLWMTGFNPGLS